MATLQYDEWRSLLRDNVGEWERQGAYPVQLHRDAGRLQKLPLGIENFRADPAAVVTARDGELVRFVSELAYFGSQGVAVGLGSQLISLRILHDANRDLFSEIAPKVLLGNRILALGLTEQHSGSNLKNVVTQGSASGDHGWTVYGGKEFVCNGARADGVLVSAVLDGGFALFLVHAGEGCTSTELRCLGWRSVPIARMEFRGARADLVASGATALNAVSNGLMAERLNFTAIAVASAERLLVDLVDWTSQRLINGERLISFSHVRQTLGEARTQLWTVSRAFEELVSRRSELKHDEVAMMKNASTRMIERIAADAVQMMGGHGCFEPSVAERTFRDSRLLAIGAGTMEVMNEVVVRGFRTSGSVTP
jgi:acyl-CoA dehydrogenase